MANVICKQIIEQIKRFNNISLFIHERPDFDAFGSTFGLKEFINTYFPDKKAYVVGTYELTNRYGSELFPFETQPLDEDFLKNSLAIICDVANTERILTNKHVLAKQIVRIDHHIQIETIGQLEWIDSNYSSASEMVAWLIYNSGYKFTPTIAKYLYAGILTDSGRFLYPSTSAKTLKIASKLLETNFDRSQVHDIIYLRTVNECKMNAYVASKVKLTSQKCAYVTLPKNIYHRFHVENNVSIVHVLNNLKDVPIWAALYYDDVTKEWKGSLRSKSLPVNLIANKFNGGGHKLACGFKLKKKSEFCKLLNTIDEYIKSTKECEEIDKSSKILQQR